MKNYFVPIIIASALAISVVIIRQKAEAQNTTPQPTDKTGATVAKAVEAKTNNPPAPGSGAASQESSPIFVTKIPPGYRDWRLISVAHEEGSLNDIRAILGNDIAIKAYREGKLPFPEGSIIARVGLELRPVGGKQQNLWPFPVFRGRAPHERGSVYGQGLKKIRLDRGLGVRSFQRRQICRRRQCCKAAYPATRLSNLATLSSPVTHLILRTQQKGMRR